MKKIPVILLLILFVSCDDSGDSANSRSIISGSKVYIVGSDDDGACYWVNGTRVALPDGDWATDIVVVDGDVYTSGTCGEYACYWINQEKYELPGVWGEGEAIAVDGNDVYVAGWFINGSCYWKNGQKINLTTNGESQAFAIGVRNNGSVYIGGSFINNHHYIIPCFWKDGNNRTNLPIPTHGDGEVFDLTFDDAGNMRYYVGETMKPDNLTGYAPKASRWRHTSRTDLPDGTSDISLYGTGAYGITIDGDDIYVAGFTDWIEDINNPTTTGGRFPRYWKNNTIHDLEGGPMTVFGTGQANDIRVADGNVVAVGIATRGSNYDDYGVHACYWLNGDLHYLDNVIGEWSEAKGVFIE